MLVGLASELQALTPKLATSTVTVLKGSGMYRRSQVRKRRAREKRKESISTGAWQWMATAAAPGFTWYTGPREPSGVMASHSQPLALSWLPVGLVPASMLRSANGLNT